MPEQDGKLSVAERRAIIAWLQETGWTADNLCPINGHGAWELIPYTAYAVPHSSSGMPSGISPFVMTVCLHCGYMRIFNAVSLGILPQASREE